jgi:hypothetical protein
MSWIRKNHASAICLHPAASAAGDLEIRGPLLDNIHMMD